jgi:hypothetical protein
MKANPRLIEQLEAIRFDPWNLMGPSQRFQRQALMQLITGERRPVAKCGVTELGAELEARYPHRHLARYPDEYPNSLRMVMTQPEPDRAEPGPIHMTNDQHRKLLHLERRTAAGETLTQAEIRELESLRDLAGQASLPIEDPRLSLDEIAAQEHRRQREAQRREITERLRAPLRGFDAGAQAGLFGDGLLF